MDTQHFIAIFTVLLRTLRKTFSSLGNPSAETADARRPVPPPPSRPAPRMIPVALDPARLAIGLAGDGPAAARRHRLLVAAGAAPIAVSTAPGATLPRLDLLWIAELPPAHAAALAAAARAAGALVNVEDQADLCDFRNTAELRRGDLLIAVTTGGQSPGLAGRIRDRIGTLFGPEWAERLAALGARRRDWRAAGHDLPELARRTEAALAEAGWLA